MSPCSEQIVDADRQAADAAAGGVVDRVGGRGVHADNADLAEALNSERFTASSCSSTMAPFPRIDVEQPPGIRFRHIGELADDRHAGIVDQGFDRAEPLQRNGRQPVDDGPIGYVGLGGERVSAGSLTAIRRRIACAIIDALPRP